MKNAAAFYAEMEPTTAYFDKQAGKYSSFN
jgi:hypothetical protein